MEYIINHGSSIKSLDDGKIGGYLVLFSDEKSPDLAGDFFTKDTDFGITDGQKSILWFNHRKPIKSADGKEIVVRERIGEGEMKVDDKGVFIEAILYNRAEYEKGLAAMGWSSGTAAHLVDREKKGNANFIKSWPLGLDASLTPRPCEPRTSVQSLKSYLDESDDDSIKSIYDIIEPGLRDGLRFEQRLDLVLAANEQVIKDAKEINELRKATKAGRKISTARMTKLKGIMSQLTEFLSEVDGEPATDEKSIDDSVLTSLVADFEYQKMLHYSGK
jgi:hypothetical protein